MVLTVMIHGDAKPNFHQGTMVLMFLHVVLAARTGLEFGASNHAVALSNPDGLSE